MIIDETYPNCERFGGGIKIIGNLISKGDIVIKCDLYITGFIHSGGNIRYKSISIFGKPTTVFIQMKLFYTVIITDSEMEIGCELHTINEWRGFTDNDILKMDGKNALRFWNEHKKRIFAIIDCK